jgi:hypothetical protein
MRDFGEALYYPSEFTRIVGPSVPIEGRVTDGKAGKPLAGFMVRAHKLATSPISGSIAAGYIRTVTDRDGRYRLEGVPLGENSLVVIPPNGSRYLIGAAEFITRVGSNSLVRDVKLTPGVLVRGRATDERTGAPVPGQLEYLAFGANPYLKEAKSFRRSGPTNHYRADKNGRFEIPVLPGKGILTFLANSHEEYPRGAGAGRIKGPREMNGMEFITEPVICVVQNYHLLTPLDPPPGTEVLDVDLTLRSGVSVSGRLLDADSRPLHDYYIYGEQGYGSWYWHPAETFTINGYFPTERRRLLFYHPERNLAAAYDLMGQSPARLEITLKPAAAIVGRIVDQNGVPRENLSIENEMGSKPPGSGSLSGADHGVLLTKLKDRHISTDAQGRFELKGIVPGLKYSASVLGPGNIGGQMRTMYLGTLFTGVTAQPGETKDLGDLRIKSPKPETEKEPKVSKNSPAASSTAIVPSAAVEGMPKGPTFRIQGSDRSGSADDSFRPTARRLWPAGSPLSTRLRAARQN